MAAGAGTWENEIMAEHRSEQRVERRVEANFNQGWGAALFIVVLTAALWFTAFTIHKRTYHSPNDPLVPSTVTSH